MKIYAAAIGIVLGASGAVWATRIPAAPARLPVAVVQQVAPAIVLGQQGGSVPPPVAPYRQPWEIWVKTPNTDFTRYTAATLPKTPGWGTPGECRPVRLPNGDVILAWFTSDVAISR